LQRDFDTQNSLSIAESCLLKIKCPALENMNSLRKRAKQKGNFLKCCWLVKGEPSRKGAAMHGGGAK
jgi:hypothetical protein